MIKASKDNIHNVNATVLNLVREALRKELILEMDQSQRGRLPTFRLAGRVCGIFLGTIKFGNRLQLYSEPKRTSQRNLLPR